MIGCYTLEEFIEAIPQPRIVWLMLPEGSITNSIVEELTNKLSAGDILIEEEIHIIRIISNRMKTESKENRFL